jgi:hypothetical protein
MIEKSMRERKSVTIIVFRLSEINRTILWLYSETNNLASGVSSSLITF